MAERRPTASAVKIPRGRTRAGDIDYLALSFAELNVEAGRWQERLTRAGVRRGDRTLVMVKPGLPLIGSVFALFAMGAVPVIIDPGMGLKSFLSCVARTRPRAVVGIPMAMLVSRIARKAFRGVQVRAGASARLDARLGKTGPGTGLSVADTGANDPAAILFTSGSTGAPKGVCYEHGLFEAQVGLVRSTYGIEAGEVDLPLLPVFALFNPALGMTTIVPEIDPSRPASVDPARIVQAIHQEGVTNSFGSPTLWSRIGSYCVEQGITLPTLRRVLCAGAPVPARLWADALRFLPKGRMHSPYGATEALPVSNAVQGEAQTESLEGADVGMPIKGMQVRVIAIDDGPVARLSGTRELPRGEIGEIIVRGPVVTKAYDALPEATAASKITDDSDGALWHRMGDTGFIDDRGCLWFCGRKAERVITADGTLFTEPCERVFRTHPRARRCALIGIGPKGRQSPALVAEADVRDSSDARDLARELRTLALSRPQTERIQIFYFRKRFPVDVRHNAKIHRLTLAEWAQTATGYRSEPKR